jgi:hypothetical protein
VTDAKKAIAGGYYRGPTNSKPDGPSEVLTRCIDAAGLTRCINEVLTKSIDRTWSAHYTGSPLPNTTSGAAVLRFHLIDLAFRKTSPPVPLDFICMRPTFLKDAITSCSQGQPPDAFSLVKTLLLRFLDLKPRIDEESTT